jgi:hypothetical protein
MVSTDDCELSEATKIIKLIGTCIFMVFSLFVLISSSYYMRKYKETEKDFLSWFVLLAHFISFFVPGLFNLLNEENDSKFA